MKLRVRNFQAVADASLDVEGLTVVTGKSNTGKTALIRATAAMLFGLPGDHFVRRGEDWTGGTLALDSQQEPLRITWRKVPTAKRKPNLQPTLEINGTEHTKIGRDHKNLTAPYGIAELETTATRLRPQVAMQHDPIFLVGENETTCAEVFKLLGRVDVITAAQGLARTDLREAEQRRKLRTEDRTKAEAAAQELAYTTHLNEELAILRTRLETAEQEGVAAERARATLRELSSLSPTPVPTPPTLGDPSGPAAQLRALRELTDLKPTRIPTAPPAPKPPDPEISRLLMELMRTDDDIFTLYTERQTIQTQLEATERGMESAKAKLTHCPTCGKILHDGRRSREGN